MIVNYAGIDVNVTDTLFTDDDVMLTVEYTDVMYIMRESYVTHVVIEISRGINGYYLTYFYNGSVYSLNGFYTLDSLYSTNAMLSHIRSHVLNARKATSAPS